MTSLTDEDLDRLEALAKAALKAAPGEWERDCQDSEGAYGSGPDARHGFWVPVLYVGGKQVLTADGSEIALICEECDEDECSAWDDTSMDVVDYIAAANPAAILALLSAARSQGPGEGWEPIERVRAYIAEFKPRCYPDAGGLARRTAFQEIEDLLPPAPPASQIKEG